MMELGIKEPRTITDLMRDGGLPPYSFGSTNSKVKGWHVAVLKHHHMLQYEELQKHLSSVS